MAELEVEKPIQPGEIVESAAIKETFLTPVTKRVVSDVGTGTRNTDGYVRRKTFVKKTVDWTGAITGTTVWDPTSGTKFIITDIVIAIVAGDTPTVTLFDGTDNTTNRVFKETFDGTTIHKFHHIAYAKPFESSTADNILKITTSAGNGSITVSGYEE